MDTALANLSSGMILAWMVLPLLAATAKRGGRPEPASQYRALVTVLALASLVFTLPFVRAMTDAGSRLELPVPIAHGLSAARRAVVWTRFGGVSPLGLVALGWLAVALSSAAREALVAMSVRGLVRRARPAPVTIAARTERLACEVGVRAPRCLVSDECSIPFTVGVLRPALVLPRALLDAFALPDLDLILLHELAHVARRDATTSAFLLIPRVLFALHPTARRLFSELHLARELAVDADVAEIDADAYPRVLIDVACHARFGARLYGVVGMHRSHLAQRLDALVDHGPRCTVNLTPALAVAACVIGSALVAPRLGRCPLDSHAPDAVVVPSDGCPSTRR